VRIDPGQIAALGSTLEDVRQLIAASTVNGAKGTLNSGRTSVTLDSNDQLNHAAEYAALIVSARAEPSRASATWVPWWRASRTSSKAHGSATTKPS